jgi:hypothetical protein
VLLACILHVMLPTSRKWAMPMKPDYNHVSHRPYQHQKDSRLSTIGMRATGSRALYALTRFPFFQGESYPSHCWVGTLSISAHQLSLTGLWFIPPKAIAILSTTLRMARIHSFDPDFETRPPGPSRESARARARNRNPNCDFADRFPVPVAHKLL